MLLFNLGYKGAIMDLQTKFLGATILTYFVSRLTLRLPNPLGTPWGILLAHAIALAIIAAFVAAWRNAAGGFAAGQLLVYLSPQIMWCILDLLRKHPVGFKKPTAESWDQAR